MLGPNGHDEKFDFYLQRYCREATKESYKLSPFVYFLIFIYLFGCAGS